MGTPEFIPLPGYRAPSDTELHQRSAEFLATMRCRRSVRHFSSRPVPREVIANCVATAASAPSGANLQPWHFVVVESLDTKRQIRAAAEQGEREFYEGRASEQWLDDLAPLGTGPQKPFLQEAPYLIAIFVEPSSPTADGAQRTNYYARLSAGIALGMLITAVHQAGLVCLPYTPSRMGFLSEILNQPPERRPMTLLVVGHPAADAQVPAIARKSLETILTWA